METKDVISADVSACAEAEGGPALSRSKPYNSVPSKFLDESIPEIRDWMTQGRALAQAASGHQWQIADWMLWGENNVGNIRCAYDYAEIATGYKRKTLQEWAYVARHLSMRMEDLSFNHHQVVAALLPDAQKRCLEYAVARRPHVPVGELREMARWQPHRLEIAVEGKDAASLLLKFHDRKELDTLEIQARQMGFVSDEYNSALGQFIWQLIANHIKASPEPSQQAVAAYRALADG
jgi:hypothetical protein